MCVLVNYTCYTLRAVHIVFMEKSSFPESHMVLFKRE